MFGDLKKSRLVAYSATFIGLIAIGSWISIPFIPVPITLQTFFVLLSAAVMKRYAVVPVVLYVLLGAIGLPVFHNGIAGIGILLGPTGGYLIGFIPAALIAGFFFEGDSSGLWIIGLVAATLIIYLFGIAWLAYSTKMAPEAALIAGMVPFLPGDSIKAAAVFTIARRSR